MSESVILNIDRSIALASEYWVSLCQASSPILADFSFTGELPVKSLAHSLAYYNKDKGVGLADVLAKLEGSLKHNIYDFRLVEQITDVGIHLPKNVTVCRQDVDYSLLADSLSLIEEAWPAGYRELMAYVTGFIVVGDSGIRSLTGPTWFGAVFLGKMIFERNRIDDLATSILHEVGHLVLYAQSAVNPPMEDIQAEVYSPFVKRNRPAIMVFHAQIAMARMILWLFSLKQFMLKNAQQSKLSDRIDLSRINNAIREYGRCYLEAMDNLKQIKVTNAGSQMIRDFESIAHILKASNL